MNSFSRFLFSSMLLISTNVFADVYKCVDTAGKISYSQNPCRDAKNVQQKVNINIATPAVSTDAQKNEQSLAKKNEEFKQRRALKADYESCLASKVSPVCIGPNEIATRRAIVR